MNITQDIIDKLNKTLDAGLCYGKGRPIPGRMCVEAAVCYALDLPHSDDPPCVSRAVRAVKIRLNDSNWSSNAARAEGLRKLAIAQLGSSGVIDDVAFTKRLAELTIRRLLPRALRRANLENVAIRCETEGTRDAAHAAADAAYAARGAASADAVRAASAARDASDYVARAAASAASAASADADRDATYAARDARDAYVARAAASAASAASADDCATYPATVNAAVDTELTFFADLVLEVLTEMHAPGIKWLKQ